MSYIHHLATLSGTDKNNLQACLEKLDKRQSISNQEAKNCSLAISKLNKVITDRPLIDHFIKLLSTAFQLNSQETDSLKQMVQSSRNIASFNNDAEYLTIIKIAKTLQSYHSQFRPISNLNNFFNQLHSDTAFKAIIGIIKTANLSDALAIELLKAQYKQSYSFVPRTGELRNKIDGANKLLTLPEKAFTTLMTHVLRHQLNLVAGNESTFKLAEQIKNLQAIEDNKGKDKLNNTLYNAFKDKGNIRFLPTKARTILQNINKAAKKDGMENYFKAIANIPLSQFVKAQLKDYTDLLIKIEQGATPTNDELKKLDLLHDELKRHNKLDAMPNRSQAFLENYQLEQDLKKKAPLNAQKLLEKLKRGEKIGVFQAFYLSSQFPKELENHWKKQKSQIAGMKNEHNFYLILKKQIDELSQDVRDKAAEIKNLDKSSLLESFDKIIEQIRAEQRSLPFSNRRFYVKETGIYTQLTGGYFELRFRNKDFGKSYQEAMKKVIKDSQGKTLSDIAASLQQFKLIPHRGTDFTGWLNSAGNIVNYIKDSEINPTISKVIYISGIIPLRKNNPDYKEGSDKPKRINIDTKDITILEYNDDTDKMVSTSIRHLFVENKDANLLVTVGQILTNKTPIGTYKLPSKFATPNEHTHIEKRLVDIAKIRKMLKIDKQKIIADEITTFINTHNKAKYNERKQGKFKESEFIKSVNSMSSSAEKDFVGLFTPSSNIANQIRANAKKDWEERSSKIIKANDVSTDKDIKDVFGAIHNGILRDISSLRAMIDLLLRMKLMLKQVDEVSDRLNKTIQNAQKTVLDLEDNFKNTFGNKMEVEMI